MSNIGDVVLVLTMIFIVVLISIIVFLLMRSSKRKAQQITRIEEKIEKISEQKKRM